MRQCFNLTSLIILFNLPCLASSLTSSFKPSRRDFIAASSSLIVLPRESKPANAGSGSLAEKLSKRDPSVLINSIFNVPPSAQVYPNFMRGSWSVTCKYGGYLFPSQKISRQTLTSNAQIPGFQKCSIVGLSDVGIDSFQYTLSIDETTGLEDRIKTLTTQIDSNLGYSAVQKVLYDNKKPNRISIDFVEYKTKNAERIELFVNGRESESIVQQLDSNIIKDVFVSSEYIRQVTFSTGSEVGIPRQGM